MHAYNSESSISSDASCSSSSDERENDNGKRKKSARSGRSARKVRDGRQSRKKSTGSKKSTFTERPLVKNQWNPERGPIRKPEENEENMTKGRDHTGRMKIRNVIQNTAVNRHWTIRDVKVKKIQT